MKLLIAEALLKYKRIITQIKSLYETGKINAPETVESPHALSYDEVKSKWMTKNNLRKARPLFFYMQIEEA